MTRVRPIDAVGHLASQYGDRNLSNMSVVNGSSEGIKEAFYQFGEVIMKARGGNESAFDDLEPTRQTLVAFLAQVRVRPRTQGGRPGQERALYTADEAKDVVEEFSTLLNERLEELRARDAGDGMGRGSRGGRGDGGRRRRRNEDND